MRNPPVALLASRGVSGMVPVQVTGGSPTDRISWVRRPPALGPRGQGLPLLDPRGDLPGFWAWGPPALAVAGITGGAGRPPPRHQCNPWRDAWQPLGRIDTSRNTLPGSVPAGALRLVRPALGCQPQPAPAAQWGVAAPVGLAAGGAEQRLGWGQLAGTASAVAAGAFRVREGDHHLALSAQNAALIFPLAMFAACRALKLARRAFCASVVGFLPAP